MQYGETQLADFDKINFKEIVPFVRLLLFYIFVQKNCKFSMMSHSEQENKSYKGIDFRI